MARGVVEDDLQEAALAALRKPERVERKVGWLRATARNVSRARERRGQIWSRVRTRLPEPEGLQVDPAERAELRAALRRAMTTLPPPIAEAVRLRFFEELTTREIAERQGCPHGTARWRVHEGLRRLRRDLDDAHGGREAWLPAALALAEIPTAPNVSPLKGTAMSSTTISIATAILLSAYAVVGLHDDPQTPRGAPPALPELTALAAGPTHANARPEQPSVTTRPAPVAASSTKARQSAPTPQPDEEQAAEDAAMACADEALRTFNLEPDDPHAQEYMFDAAQCYDDAGLWGRTLWIYKVMLRDYPEGEHTEVARARSLELYARVLAPEPEPGSTSAAFCMAPVSEASEAERPHERAAAAECLRRSGYVGAASQQRKIAARGLRGDDRTVNAEALAKLQESLVRYRAAFEQLQRAAQED